MKKLLLLMLLIMVIAPAYSQKRSRERASNDIIVTGVSDRHSAYQNLVQRQSLLSEQIGVLSAEFSQARGGKARKLSSQIEKITSDIAVVERLIATFPQPKSEESIQQLDAQFRREIDSVAAIRIAATDPFAGRISQDPELERMYREYLAQNSSIALPDNPSSATAEGESSGMNEEGQVTYRVMIAISKTQLPASAFDGMSDIMEQRMPSGGTVYYQGAYASIDEAQGACRSILAAHRFRDAFVVAMIGNKRVSLQ